MRELFVNYTANWILLASCLRTQQSIAMGQFTQAFFLVYPGKDDLFNLMSTVAGLVGSFICTMGTGIICDRYDNYNYMTKAYICVGTTLVSIPCCCMIYLCTTNFWISISGLFIEYLLSTGWGQPAIGILATVVDPGVRGTAVSVFFFFITIFGVIAPQGYSAIQTYYGLDPIEEPVEFGIFICLCTVIPCILAVPCFYIAGVKYSWFKYHEAMFMLDVWNEMEQWYQEDISKKRWYQAQLNGGPDPADAANLSVSVDWRVLREQRKIKVKNLKKQNLDLKDVKPTLKKRAGLVGAHGQMVKKRTIVANFQEDETPSDFPDTRSYAEHEESFRFDKYAQSWDGRRQYFQE